ncbi:hypothetical protein [Cystobacter fuscus]|uniref:hypothetical protein n=1 Tax=Cystobacter fuscus TaxID=43 RepID=UPI0012DFC0D2|nr:hypothetical protein [Cystobacter fuscus]
MEDPPSPRQPHADLNEAVSHHPEESFPRNHRALAAARDIPIIATERASGFHSCHEVPRGDVPAVLSRMDALDG